MKRHLFFYCFEVLESRSTFSRYRGVTLGASLCAALLLSACGGGDAPTSGSDVAVSQTPSAPDNAPNPADTPKPPDTTPPPVNTPPPADPRPPGNVADEPPPATVTAAI